MTRGEADMWAQKNRLTIRFFIGSLVMLGWFVLLRPAQAVEFGDTTVFSFIGQPLVAEVELTALTAEESAALQVKQAGRDVYSGANIRFNPVLSGLRWVVQHRDKRQFLRLSTEKPINATYLNMFFELGLKTDFAVRALTVWVEPNPNAKVAAADSTEAAQDAEEEAQARGETQPEIAELPQASQASQMRGPMLDRLLEYRRNNGSADSGAGFCNRSQQRCLAIERENRLIAANISELENSVRVLRKAIIPESQVINPEKPEPANLGGESGAPADLFLKQEEPLLPKPLVVKPSFWKTLTWKTLALAGAALAVVGALGYLMVLKRRKKAGVKPSANANNSPANKPANPPANKPVKTSVWRKWREILVDKWRKKFGRKPKITLDESTGEEIIVADEAGREADQLADNAGKKSRWSFRLPSFMSALIPLRQKMAARMEAISFALQEFWAKLRKKSAGSAAKSAE